MSSFKILHSFTVTLDREIEETVVTEKDGQKTSVTSKVNKPLNYTIILKEPSRSEKNELALFKDVTYGYAIDKGLVPKIKIQQKLSKDDAANPLSEDEDKNLGTLQKRLRELETQFIEMNVSSVTVTEELKERKEKVLQEYLVLHRKVEDMNTAYQSVYAHTAENYTHTKMLTWLTLFLTYIKDPTQSSDSVPRPMFPGSDYSIKEEKLGDLEDSSNDLFIKAIEKLPTYWMLYLFGRANKTEDYAKIEEEWQKEAKIKQELEGKIAETEKSSTVEPTEEKKEDSAVKVETEPQPVIA